MTRESSHATQLCRASSRSCLPILVSSQGSLVLVVLVALVGVERGGNRVYYLSAFVRKHRGCRVGWYQIDHTLILVEDSSHP